MNPHRNSEYRRVNNVERKISATARLPKRSTIIESPAGKIAHPSDIGQCGHRSHEPTSQNQYTSANYVAQPQRPQVHQLTPEQESLLPYHLHTPPSQHSTQSPPSQYAKPNLAKLPIDPHPGQVLRPAFARNNTEIMILEDSTPNSPTGGEESRFDPANESKAFSLGDIHSIVEAVQAREQHRSLPRETSLPYIAELSALELAIAKHFAVLALTRSPLKDSFDLEELLEMVEPKKSNFWQKLFRGDKKAPKKKSTSYCRFFSNILTLFNSSLWRATRSVGRKGRRRFLTWRKWINPTGAQFHRRCYICNETDG